MKFLNQIKTQPAKGFFYLAVAALIIFIYLFRVEFQLNKFQNSAEQTVHNAKAAFLMLSMFSGLAAGVYTLLSKWGKMTLPSLNLLHFVLLLSFAGLLLFDFLRPKPSLQELNELLSGQRTNWVELISNWLFIGSFLVLIVNFFAALFRKNKV